MDGDARSRLGTGRDLDALLQILRSSPIVLFALDPDRALPLRRGTRSRVARAQPERVGRQLGVRGLRGVAGDHRGRAEGHRGRGVHGGDFRRRGALRDPLRSAPLSRRHLRRHDRRGRRRDLPRESAPRRARGRRAPPDHRPSARERVARTPRRRRRRGGRGAHARDRDRRAARGRGARRARHLRRGTRLAERALPVGGAELPVARDPRVPMGGAASAPRRGGPDRGRARARGRGSGRARRPARARRARRARRSAPRGNRPDRRAHAVVPLAPPLARGRRRVAAHRRRPLRPRAPPSMGGGGARRAPVPAPAVAEDGGRRSPRGRHRARLQQPAHRHRRKRRVARRSGRAGFGGCLGRPRDPARRRACDRAHAPAPLVRTPEGPDERSVRREPGHLAPRRADAPGARRGRRRRAPSRPRALADRRRRGPARAGARQPRGERARRHAARRHAPDRDPAPHAATRSAHNGSASPTATT